MCPPAAGDDIHKESPTRGTVADLIQSPDMPEFYAAEPCPDIPDDVTIAQFILDSNHPARPVRPHNVPWFIDDATGRRIGYEEVSPVSKF